MKYILEKNNFYNIGDIIYIEYWYKPTGKDRFITPVKILEIKGRKYTISHDVEKSKIQNAPDELIKPSQIISKI
jgi:hypothetical protein